VQQIFLAAVYQYAAGGTAPAGFSQDLIESAFTPKEQVSGWQATLWLRQVTIDCRVGHLLQGRAVHFSDRIGRHFVEHDDLLGRLVADASARIESVPLLSAF
jgi:hypothetical protein